MIKTFTFGGMHITVAFLVVWLMTGDWLVGGAVALVEPCVNTIAYYFHEKIWSAFSASRSAPSGLPGTVGHAC